ncbi:MAG: hypothetical protein K1X94_29495 [Sandaracinaceae bacterium]|nr:hypothetical protein [Sandaracinaceae bacterium]
MNDEELDDLLSHAKGDLPSPSELEGLRSRLELGPRGGGGGPTAPRGPTLGPGTLAASLVVLGLLGATATYLLSAPGSRGPSARPPSSSGQLVPSDHTSPDHASSEPPSSDHTSGVPTPEPTHLTPERGAVSPETQAAAPATPSRHDTSGEARSTSRHAPITRPPAIDHGAAIDVTSTPVEPAAQTGETEVAMLARATSALRRGDLSSAREALRAHATAYPRGVLAEERASLEVELALRTDPAAGERALAGFRRAYPSSGHLARLDRLAASER